MQVTVTTPAKLYDVLRRQMGLSYSQVKRLKANDAIYCNGQPRHVDHSCRPGDVVRVDLSAASRISTHVLPVCGPVQLCYEDAYLQVVNKPAGQPIHPSPGHSEDTLANFYAHLALQRGWDPVLRPLTRLDRNTSGAVLLARDAHSAYRLQQMLPYLHKGYLAVVHGTIAAPGRVDAPILDDPAGALRRSVHLSGRPACTRYWPLAAGAAHTLLYVQPLTGRTHQIRVHLSHIGYPLVGDFLYGREEPQRLPRHALHCVRLGLQHPFTGELLQVEAPPAADLLRLCGELFPLLDMQRDLWYDNPITEEVVL